MREVSPLCQDFSAVTAPTTVYKQELKSMGSTGRELYSLADVRLPDHYRVCCRSEVTSNSLRTMNFGNVGH